MKKGMKEDLQEMKEAHKVMKVSKKAGGKLAKPRC